MSQVASVSLSSPAGRGREVLSTQHTDTVMVIFTIIGTGLLLSLNSKAFTEHFRNSTLKPPEWYIVGPWAPRLQPSSLLQPKKYIIGSYRLEPMRTKPCGQQVGLHVIGLDRQPGGHLTTCMEPPPCANHSTKHQGNR